VINTLPSEVLSAVQEFRTCEFTTLSKGGVPVTWPVSALYQPEQNQFLLTSSIGFPQKAFNIRRNPRVSLLFSNPTGSGLTNPPSVLIQGDATAVDKIMVSFNEVDGLREYWRDTILRRQPGSMMFSDSAIMRTMMDYYYMRILICVVPRAVYWWPESDFSKPAVTMEAVHVE
jgi:hypothetical protein